MPSPLASTTDDQHAYMLRYFPLRWRAEGARFLLLAKGSTFKEETPSWPAERSQQPLSQLPVLVERSAADGSEFVLSDSVAIERYLAARAGLLVQSGLRDSAREMQLRAQMEDIHTVLVQYKYGHEAGREMAMDKYRRLADSFVGYHEELLRRNGSSGHYFGEAITYADICLYLLLVLIRSPPDGFPPACEEPFSSGRAPAINRVYHAVREDALARPYVAWLEKDDPAAAARLASF
ncbi:hypothetical protein L249_3209 [Ophiocordyceps polyrhachis-furcata BCC 54312]|uniref:GST N-terminal domain-containing protein n=1 Tax=Ophiocordyceps polyrhachis-furcata BCC 54312 TaxID=1330021 RepID=A0A367LPG2_9HYPO|nr:hypothetical protein L249_3209 [Ophiocordyceps polyrhachis-furcata BCC 54312]